jgi:hypothetical protein
MSKQQGMHRRETTMFDGRYLYYYTFDDDAAAGEAAQQLPEPGASAEAAEEQDV